MTQARGKRTLGKRRATGLALLLFALLVLAAILSCPLMTLASLKQVSDHPLYVMRYYGPHTSDLLLRTGIEGDIYERIRQMAMPEECTCFVGLSTDGEKIFGRNGDGLGNVRQLLDTSGEVECEFSVRDGPDRDTAFPDSCR